ncbi:L,D-transpeptidase [Nostoc sp. UHCC 0302]|uniref:L,D-transpeptidase n=1 Tax=Nostoc sp. UHCC 0302 TaxID=3134896 RepID=UPI00311CA1EC
MAMGKNESVGRMVMLLCFGTAILSLAVHWRITVAQGYVEEPASASLPQNLTKPNSQQSRLDGSYRKLSEAGLGEIALGAGIPTRSPKSSAIKPHTKSETISKNVASVTDQPSKRLLVAPGQKDNSTVDKWPKFLFAQASSPQTSSNVKTQVVVDLSDRRAYVYAKDEVIASYPLAIGKKGWETPTGNFQVRRMQHHPIWRHPITGKIFDAGTDSPLGDRWIGFWTDGRNEIGFHGTPDTELIGTAVSHGCLRMRNPDVRLLYEQVSLGTPVVVRN